ncbi:MAG: zf-TFIIB domain-containing protein [bacterium]
MNCPVCNERLQITYRYDIEIDYCPFIQDNQKIDNYKSKQYFDEHYNNPNYHYDKKYEDEDYYKYKKKKKYKDFLEDLFDIF